MKEVYSTDAASGCHKSESSKKTGTIRRNPAATLLLGLTLSALIAITSGCDAKPKPTRATRLSAPEQVQESTHLLRPVEVGASFTNHPWIAHVNVADLDQDGLNDILACESRENKVLWLRQTGDIRFEEIVIHEGTPAPVHAEAYDMDGDGDLDILLSSMGQVFPNNDKIGSVVILENDGFMNFRPHVIAEKIARVCDIRAGDFDEDGLPDLAVAQFGYDQGELRWMRNLGHDWQFESIILLSLSGPVNVLVADFTGNGHLDIASNVSQQWEEVYLFANEGGGRFVPKVIFGSTNEDYGSSGISTADLNRDGRIDILFTNGDGFDYAEPGPRPWHGVQWLENMGGGFFRHHWIGDMPGAYSPVEIDLDRDGFRDVIAVSGFNDWSKPNAASLMWFRNDGNQRFEPHVLAHHPTHLMCAASGDLTGEGFLTLVTGGFHAYPPYNHRSRLLIWERADPVK